MQSISVFLDKAKFADFRLKNADVSSQQNSRGVSRDSYIFWIFYTCAKFHYSRGDRMSAGGGGFLPPSPPSVSSPEKAQPW